MEEYVKVDIKEYVNEVLKNNSVIEAENFARIIAKQGSNGEEVISWNTDKDKDEVLEKRDFIKPDAKGNMPWIAIKADSNGEPIIDVNGHDNRWIIDNDTFNKKYEKDTDSLIYKPKGGIQKFVQITDNIILKHWGCDMKIAKGGFINITNPNDLYGISKRDFEDTYKIIDILEKSGLKL